MGRWVARDEDGHVLFVVESLADRSVSLHVPSPRPLIVGVEVAEHDRMIIGSAIADARYR